MPLLEHRAAVNTIQIASFLNERWQIEEKKMYIRGLRNRPDGITFWYKVEISIMSTPRFDWSQATSCN
jgi:hypothetical protein